jgi:hypothetical protein
MFLSGKGMRAENRSLIYVLVWLLTFGGAAFTLPSSAVAAKIKAPAELIAPEEGVVLSSEEVVFRWTEGNLVSRYRLVIGTQPMGAESKNIFIQTFKKKEHQAVVTSSAFVSGNPVYVKLRSKIQNRWVTQGYVFQTQSIPTQCGDGICQPDEGYALCPVDCPSPLCGDGICSAMDGEDGNNCQPDCTLTCGNGICEPDEGHALCGMDCPSPFCGNGVCSAMDGEDGNNCQPDCALTCGNGICEKEEGYVLCGMDCPSPLCGDGVCSAIDGEDGTNCQPDCTLTCGNGICEPDEGHVLCGMDCPSPLCGDGICSAMDGEDGTNCQPE